MERVVRKQNYKNAFNCKRCPGTDDETGCPDWWRWEEKNEKGEARIVEQCGRAAAKHFEIQRLNNTRFTVDNVVATRNTIADAAEKLITFFSQKREMFEAITDDRPQSIVPQIPEDARRSAPRLAESGAESPSDFGERPPCQSPEFSGF